MKEWLLRVDIVRVSTAFTVLAVFLFITYALIFINVPEGNKEIVHNLIGIIEGTVMTLVSFEFGSSKGAQPKDVPDTINKSTFEIDKKEP